MLDDLKELAGSEIKEAIIGMTIHEIISHDFGSILRVVGGWVYTIETTNGFVSSVFVPERT